MPFRRNRYYSFEEAVDLLRALKRYHRIGIYEEVVTDSEFLSADDQYEFVQLALEHVAPIFSTEEVSIYSDNERAELDVYQDDHLHQLYRMSSPDMQAYYGLCRMYEYQQGLTPEENPFVQEADRHYCQCLSHIYAHFWAGFDDDKYTTQLVIEICPDNYTPDSEFVEALHDILAYYTEHLPDLRVAILLGPPSYPPALPEAQSCKKRGGNRVIQKKLSA